MTRAPADAAVVIVNWNGRSDTLACLDSLGDSTLRARVIVVDNGSSDGSVDAFQAHPAADCVISNATNAGYAGGVNLGVREALRQPVEYICILNNDTLVQADSLERLRAHLASTPEPMAVCPDIRYQGDPERTWFGGAAWGADMPRHVPQGTDGESQRQHRLRETEFLTGCCLMSTRAVWERVGLFDERYFLIFEDSDWSQRARRCGITLAVASDAVVLHAVSRSFRGLPATRLGAFYFTRNGLRFAMQYRRRTALAFSVTHILRPGARRSLGRGGRTDAVAFRLLGLAAFAAGGTGRAPRIVERMARWAA